MSEQPKLKTVLIEGEAVSAGGILSEPSPDQVFSKSPPEMNSSLTIQVKRVGGGDAPYVTLEDVSPQTSVLELKNMVYFRALNTKVAASTAQQPVPVERQRLIYAGRMLTDDNEVLGEGVKMKPGDVTFVHLVPIPKGKTLSARNRNENKGGREKSVAAFRNRRVLSNEVPPLESRRRARRNAAAPYPSWTQRVGTSAQRSAPTNRRLVVQSPVTSPLEIPTSTVNAAQRSRTGTRAPVTSSLPCLSISNGVTPASAGQLRSNLLELTRAQQGANSLLQQSVGASLAAPSPFLGSFVAPQQQPIALAEAILHSTQMPPSEQNNTCSSAITDDVVLLSREAMPLHECLAPALRTVNEIIGNESLYRQQRNTGLTPTLESIVRPAGQQAQISSALQDVADLLERSSRQSDHLARLLRSIDVGASPGQIQFRRNSQLGDETIQPAASTASLLAAAVGVPAISGSASDLLAAPAGNIHGSCNAVFPPNFLHFL